VSDTIPIVPAGRPAIDLVKLGYQSDLPVLLVGPHGVGKSQIFGQAAAELGIEHLDRDLSMMEPTDLAGLPAVGEDGRTRYAAPGFLPEGGKGLLVMEELGRAARYMRAPCLQLLTSRKLNDYRLPPGWLPCATDNGADGGYHNDELDPAHLSRFVRVRLTASAEHWLAWAEASGVHERVREFVRHAKDAFTDPDSNPRAWAYAGRLLAVWEAGGGRADQALETGLAGVLGVKWGTAFLAYCVSPGKPIDPGAVLADYAAARATLLGWVKHRRLDLIGSTLDAFLRHLQGAYDQVVADAVRKANAEAFLGDLPPDLKLQASGWLGDHGYDRIKVRVKAGGRR
jgi:hypothetical protein